MEKELSIKVENVSKSFSIPVAKKSTLQSYFVNPFEKTKHRNLIALKNITFDVRKNEFFSIIGKNGAGKSTLLKIISGIYIPDSGSVKVQGRLVPFLELGVGFHPDLTARENVFLNGVLLGLSKKEITEQFDEIFRFAGLEEFTDVPIKKFSSGMEVRLAFSVSIRVKSEILALDEVLAVGDAKFQQKCYRYFDKIKGTKTMLFVSHDLKSVEKYSDRVLLLKKNNEYEIGHPKKMIEKYLKE